MRQPADEARLAEEQSWARRVRSGELAALEEAFKACYPGMCSFVRAHVGSAETAEDLVQDVFMRVWQTRERLDVNGSLRSLLYRSAHNAALNYLKHRNVESRWARSVTASPPPTPRDTEDDPAATEELRAAIADCLAALPERCRLVFVMNRHQGLTYNEIAVSLGISIKTVETQMGRALKALRAKLAVFLT
jgi:RNA polymerase sigma-70 factor, ECF subfamily